jgi:cell filamentation protein
MKSGYQYIDPDYTYTDPQTGVLRNKNGIQDKNVLVAFESFKVTERLERLKARPLKVKDSSTLFAIHRHLFQDVYEWAGQRRTVEISKGGKPFFPTSHFDNALRHIDSLVAEYKAIAPADKPFIAKKLAEILDTVNFLHPFREGNGRTQREFLRSLALEKGFEMNLNPADNADVYERYMAGTVNGDMDILAALIFEIIREVEATSSDSVQWRPMKTI